MPVVQSWDYEIFDLDQKKYDDIDALEQDLKAMGKAGWDMCGIHQRDDLVFFKKPIDGIMSYTGEGSEEHRRLRPPRPHRHRHDDDEYRSTEELVTRLGGK